MIRKSFRNAFRPLAAALVLFAALAGAPAANAIETLYLTNTEVVDDTGQLVTELYLVDIDDNGKTADVALIDVIPYEKVDALACTPDDRSCFLIDKYHPVNHPNGGRWGRYDFLSRTFTTLGEVLDESGERIPGIVLAGHSPGPRGKLIFGSQETDSLYVLDTTIGTTTELGPIVVEGSETLVDLNGADLVFTSDSRLFVWANSARMPEAPAGLYEVLLPEFGGDAIRCVYLGTGTDGADPGSHFFTGLAVRENGLGDIVGSNRFDELHQQARDGSDVDLFHLQRDGEPLGHVAGDMHHSYDCFLNVELDRDEVAPGGTLQMSVRLIHNRTKEVETPFVMWIEDRDGNVVLERQTAPRRLAWGDSVVTTVPVAIPDWFPAGGYTLYVGMSEMRQGEASARQTFKVRYES